MQILKKRKNGTRSVGIDFTKDPGRTKQKFREECDINTILAKFRKTGALTHYAKHAPEYGYASGLQFAEAMRIVQTGNNLYEDLPSHIKKDFPGGPSEFLDFVQDPANAEKVREYFGEAPLTPAEPSTTEPSGNTRQPVTADPANETDQQPQNQNAPQAQPNEAVQAPPPSS